MKNTELIKAGHNLTSGVVLSIIGVVIAVAPLFMDATDMQSILPFAGVGGIFSILGVIYIYKCGASLVKAGQE